MEGFDGISYKDRLRELGLMTLETRRIRADLIEVFKILRGMAGAVEGMGLVRDEGGRKGHDHILYINSVRLDVGIKAPFYNFTGRSKNENKAKLEPYI